MRSTIVFMFYYLMITKSCLDQLRVYDENDEELKEIYCEILGTTRKRNMKNLTKEAETDQRFKRALNFAKKSKTNCPNFLLKPECIAVKMSTMIKYMKPYKKILICELKTFKVFTALLHSAVSKLSRIFSHTGITVYTGVKEKGNITRGLGNTMKELDVGKYPVFEKTQFSMCVPEVEKHLKSLGDLKSVVICGIEAHACVLQTTLDLLERNYEVHVVVDATSSRSMVDRMFALERMKAAGAFLTTSESLLFLWCKDAKHPKFKDAQKLILTPSPDSGLLSGGTPV